MQYIKRKNTKLNGMQVLSIGFLVIIILGALILSLPISSADGKSTRFIDSLFTSTSAVCVTGLVTVDTGTHWNVFGQIIIMILIEIGGLGFMSFTTLIALLIGKKISLRDRLTLQNAINTFDINEIVKMVRYIVKFTLSVQLIGAAILAVQFIPEYGVLKGIFFGVFHSISAFCNAGFDIIGNGVSLTTHNSNTVIILVLSALIIIGGLGFSVWSELIKIRKIENLKKLSLHSKVVLLVTGVLIIGGAMLMFLFEHRNPNTMAAMKWWDKISNSIFAAATPRTAGFNSISTSCMTTAGQFLTIVLMFVGGSPGSTAGGLKTTTIGILIFTVICVIKGREDTEIFMKKISKDIVYKAFTLVFIGLSLILVVTMILSYTEIGATFIELLYETVSAFTTAGLTLGLTAKLSNIGKVLIMIMMYLGRVGPLTVVLALTREKYGNGIKYPEGKILIG